MGMSSSSEYLLKYLHDTGVVFYRDSLFHDHILPQTKAGRWLLFLLCFTGKNATGNCAIHKAGFTRSLLEDLVWQDYSMEEQKLFLEMMQSCGICFMHQRGNERARYRASIYSPGFSSQQNRNKGTGSSYGARGIPTEKLVFEYEWHQAWIIAQLHLPDRERSGARCLVLEERGIPI